MARYNTAAESTAVLAQTDHIIDWLAGLSESDWTRPSVLPGWTVGVLTGHIIGVLRSVPALLARRSRDKPMSLAAYFGPETAVPNDGDREEDVTAWANAGPAKLLTEIRTARTAASDALTATLPSVVATRRGAVAVPDVLLTRIWELVVHADDIGRSLPDRPPPRFDPGAVRLVTRGFAELLSTRAPGRSVEVRIPPYAAVQAIAGPRHTRGTPPGVVETDPVTWLRLATGRITWQDAVDVGAVRASGERTDLAAYLPLLG